MSTSEVMIEECMNNVSKYLSCVTGKQEGDQSQTNQGQKVLSLVEYKIRISKTHCLNVYYNVKSLTHQES